MAEIWSQLFVQIQILEISFPAWSHRLCHRLVVEKIDGRKVILFVWESKWIFHLLTSGVTTIISPWSSLHCAKSKTQENYDLPFQLTECRIKGVDIVLPLKGWLVFQNNAQFRYWTHKIFSHEIQIMKIFPNNTYIQYWTQKFELFPNNANISKRYFSTDIGHKSIHYLHFPTLWMCLQYLPKTIDCALIIITSEGNTSFPKIRVTLFKITNFLPTHNIYSTYSFASIFCFITYFCMHGTQDGAEQPLIR